MGLALGTFDVGLRHTVLRKFTEGLPENKIGANDQYWRKFIPIVAASALTCWMRAPFEIANKAFRAD